LKRKNSTLHIIETMIEIAGIGAIIIFLILAAISLLGAPQITGILG
jgi:hypothetical protein